MAKNFFLKTVAKEDYILQTMVANDITPQDLVIIYKTMLAATPNKCLNVGGPLLIPTLILMEPERINHIVGFARHRMENNYYTDWENAIVDVAAGYARMIYNEHAKAGMGMNITSETPAKEFCLPGLDEENTGIRVMHIIWYIIMAFTLGFGIVGTIIAHGF